MLAPAALAKKDVKAFDEASCRRRREESAVALSRKKKEASAAKKRNMDAPAVEEEAAAVPEVLSVANLGSYVEGVSIAGEFASCLPASQPRMR